MKKVSYEDISEYSEYDYIWYACYGSNINTDRLMIYINGDKNNKLGSVLGCKDKSKPLDEKPYIFKYPIYFAGVSKKWNGGMAFLDYLKIGKSYGKIYKIKMGQFRDILKQENDAYNLILYLEDYEGLPIFTFTRKYKGNDLNSPSKEYCDVIKKGILDTYSDLDNTEIDKIFY